MHASALNLQDRRRIVFLVALSAFAASLLSAPEILAADMKEHTLDRVKKAAVMVFTAISKGEKGDTPRGSGSGFFINRTGLCISNNHVVDPSHNKPPEEKFREHYQGGKLVWSVVTESGTDDEKTWDAVVIYQNESADQALLQVYEEDGVKLETPDYLRFQPESRLRERMKVWALGFPGGDKSRSAQDKHPIVSLTEGNVLEMPRSPGGRIRMVYTDVIARPGNSGGPMVDRDGFLVGTVTLMKPPEGREDAGGGNYSALVPAALSNECLRNAMVLGKIVPGTDVTPFMTALTDGRGRISVPDFDRKSDRDVLFYADGDRIYGKITTDSIAWNSPLGQFDIPAQAIAYIMSNDESTTMFLEGGNRLTADTLDATFSFQPDGGSPGDQPFGDIQAIAFKTEGRSVAPVVGKVLVFDTDTSHLVLSDVKGAAKFKSRTGTLSIELEAIYRIDIQDDDRHVFVLNDGRRMTGDFEPSPIEATIAATKTHVKFDLSKIRTATFEVQTWSTDAPAGLGLVAVLDGASDDILEIAMTLVSDDPSGARPELDRAMDPSAFRRLPESKKERLRLLNAVEFLRAGKGKKALKAFRQASRATDGNIAAYAEARVVVLKRYSDLRFEEVSLTDPAVLVRAGKSLAREIILRARDVLKDGRTLEGKFRGDYMKTINEVRKLESGLNAMAAFVGPLADDEMIRCWKLAMKACRLELDRIAKASGEDAAGSGRGRRRSSGNRRGSRRGGSNLAAQRAVDELQAQKEQTEETFKEFFLKKYDYGFHIEDADINAMRDAEGF